MLDKNVKKIESIMKDAGILPQDETLESNGYKLQPSHVPNEYYVMSESGQWIATYNAAESSLGIAVTGIPDEVISARKSEGIVDSGNLTYSFHNGMYRIFDPSPSKNRYLDFTYDMTAGRAKAKNDSLTTDNKLRGDIRRKFELNDSAVIPQQLVDFNHQYIDNVNIRPLVLDNLNTLIRQTCMEKSLFGTVSINEKKLNAVLDIYNTSKTIGPARMEGESGKDYAVRMAFSNPVLFAERSKQAVGFKGDDYLSKIGAYTNKEVVSKICAAPNTKKRIDIIGAPSQGDVEIKSITEGNKPGFLGRKNPTFKIEGKTEDGKKFTIELTQKRFNKIFVEKDQKFISFDDPKINDKFGRKMKESKVIEKPVVNEDERKGSFKRSSSQSQVGEHHHADNFVRSHSAGDLTVISNDFVVGKLLDKKYPAMSTDRVDPKLDKANIKFNVVENKKEGNVKVTATYMGFDDKKHTVEVTFDDKSEFRRMFSHDKDVKLKFENSGLNGKFSKPEAVQAK